jgi:hypothetical protein
MLALAAVVTAAFAQVGIVTMKAPGSGTEPAGDVLFQAQGPPMPLPPGGGMVQFAYAEFGGGGKVVKGAPYSAQVTTEHTQTLSDGNTIHNIQTGAMYRDSEGRTRREQPLGPIGPLPGPSNVSPPVFINDPVAGVNYVLNAENKTAQKLPVPKSEGTSSAMGAMRYSVSTASSSAGPVLAVGGGMMTQQLAAADEQSKPESLGTKMIEGVQAEGTRTVMTIPAGQIGNSAPIESVSERWYSPQLQTVVLSTNSDPRMGETTYRLTNISLGEPPHTLFEVPADYKIVDGPQKMWLSK